MLRKRSFSEMAKFLIEVPHEAEEVACARAVQTLLKTGSHFLTHARDESQLCP